MELLFTIYAISDFYLICAVARLHGFWQRGALKSIVNLSRRSSRINISFNFKLRSLIELN